MASLPGVGSNVDPRSPCCVETVATIQAATAAPVRSTARGAASEAEPLSGSRESSVTGSSFEGHDEAYSSSSLMCKSSKNAAAEVAAAETAAEKAAATPKRAAPPGRSRGRAPFPVTDG